MDKQEQLYKSFFLKKCNEFVGSGEGCSIQNHSLLFCASLTGEHFKEKGSIGEKWSCEVYGL